MFQILKVASNVAFGRFNCRNVGMVGGIKAGGCHTVIPEVVPAVVLAVVPQVVVVVVVVPAVVAVV